MSLECTFDITSPFEQLVPNMPATITMEVLNAGDSSVTIGTVVPVLLPIDGGASLGIPTSTDSGALAAGATRYYTWKFVCFVPQSSSAIPSPCVFTLGGGVVDSAGNPYMAPTQTITVFLPSADAPLPAGSFLFASPLNSGNIMLW